MSIRTVKICLVVLALVSTSWSQAKPAAKDTIWLGTELSLGMPRDRVMSLLAQDFNLVRIQVQDGDAWMIHSKTDATTSPLGEVEFDKGKLTLVERDWTPADRSDSSFALALHGALERFGKEGRHMCLVDTTTNRGPSMESRTITWFCGTKRLQVITNEFFSGPYKGKSTEIQETLMLEDAGH